MKCIAPSEMHWHYTTVFRSWKSDLSNWDYREFQQAQCNQAGWSLARTPGLTLTGILQGPWEWIFFKLGFHLENGKLLQPCHSGLLGGMGAASWVICSASCSSETFFGSLTQVLSLNLLTEWNGRDIGRRKSLLSIGTSVPLHPYVVSSICT